MASTPSQSSVLSPQLLQQLERLELVSRKVFRGRLKGERRSRRKGQSVEFADFRNYVPGDDIRFIDWNLYARLDRLFLKLFLEEEDLHFYAIIDASEVDSDLFYACRFLAGDPFSQAGLFATSEITYWRKAFFDFQRLIDL